MDRLEAKSRFSDGEQEFIIFLSNQTQIETFKNLVPKLPSHNSSSKTRLSDIKIHDIIEN